MGNEHTMGIVLERDETEVGAEVDVERIHDTCGNFNHIIINPNRIILLVQYTLNAVSTLTSRCTTKVACDESHASLCALIMPVVACAQ